MSEPQPKNEHKWNADRPGWLPRHDELGRKEFAKRVAKELRGWRQKDSLVVSLNGDWGSGKTTLANLIRYYAEEQATAAKEAKPIFVQFNPWQWSGQDLVLQAFFDEVGAAFRGDGLKDRNQAERLAEFWEGLKLATVAGGELATRLQESLTALTALLAGASGVLAGRLESEFWKSALSGAGVVLLGIAAVCAVWAPVSEKLAEWFQWKSKKPKPTLEAVRGDLKRELEKLPAPVVVLIDDIDRLTKKEVRLMVQLVKANADFPNLVYVLLYQKSIVADALDKITCEAGQDFLKKIVQVELEVPAAPEHEMRRFFREQIGPVLDRAVIRWDKDRWGRLFDEAIWPWFKTPRDIKRFKGMLEFYFEAHVNEGVLEVNPIDLILLEILRAFDPQAYESASQAFQKQRNLFLEVLFEDKEAKERFSLGIKKLTERPELDPEEQERLRAVLVALFPQAQESYSRASETEIEWYRDLRICHGKHFPRYFQLGGNPGDITAAFMARLLSAGNDVAALQAHFQSAIQAGELNSLLERLRAVRQDVPKAMIEPLVTALFNVSDNLPAIESADLFSSDAERELVRIVIVLIRQIEDRNERTNILRRAIAASPAITGPMMCVSFLTPRKEEEHTERELPIDIGVLKELQQELLPRVWEAAKSGGLWKLRMLVYVLYRLTEWANMDAVKQWLATSINEPRIALTFLMEMLRESRVSGGTGSHKTYTLLGGELERFVDLETLAASAEKTASGELETAAIKTLRKAIALKAEGKPYKEIYVMSRRYDGTHYFDESDRL